MLLERFGFLKRLLPLLFLAVGAPAFAQSSGTISGTVADPSGALIAGATVTATSVATSTQSKTQTDADGKYQLPSLPVGAYDVEVTASGLQTQVAKNVIIEVASNTVQNFSMQVGHTATEVVTVEAAPSMVESNTVTVGQTIDQKTVQDIPLNGRHFVDLGLLIPGSVTPPQNGFLTAPLRGQGSFSFNTAGNREDTVNFMINGINLNDMVQNQITFQPSINTVSEFKVDNSTYSAEYGRNSGAIVNIATRSGANSFHGEGFEFIRNNDLDARNFFNISPVPQSPFKRNNFGGNLGGPILHNKTFFFFSYEGLRQRQGLTINTPVPSDTDRAAITSPTSQQLVALLPHANTFGVDAKGNPLASFVGSATAPVNIDQWTGDISHNISDTARLHGYYAFQRDRRMEPTLQGNNVPGFGDTRQSHRQVLTLSETQSFGATVVNEVRLGFNRIHITFAPNSPLNPATFGINDGQSGPTGIPQITINGLGTNFGGPSGFPQARGDTTGVLSDTLNYLRGKHSFAFGGEFRRFYNNNTTGDPGTLGFASLAAFKAGTPNSFTITLGNQTSKIATGELGFFGQDNWKVLSRLTLELGLRYDWNQTPTDSKDRFVNFIPSSDSLVRVSTPYAQNDTNFQPRVGLAWDIFGSGKTVLRSGYGVLVDQPITGLVTPLSTNPPFAFAESFVPSGTKPTTTYANLLNDSSSALTLTTVDPKFKNSYIESYNLNIQHQLASHWGMMAGYFGSVGRHLRTRDNLNQFILGTSTRPFAALSPTSPIIPVTPQGKQLTTLGNISDNMSIGNSSYNALWITSTMRAWHGLQFNSSYTFSKSLDYTSQNGQGLVNLSSGIQNSLNPAGDRGLSDFDARHRFVVNFIYDLPYHGNRVLEGWQLGSIFQAQTGNPVNILANAAAIGGYTGYATLRPDLIGPIQIVKRRLSNGNIQYFAPLVCDPASGGCAPGTTFAIPDVPVGTGRQYHFGDMGRNAIIGPGFQNVDFSLVKRTRITERFTTEFRAEAFDLLNHPNFGQPGRIASVGSTSLGVISSTRFPTGDSGSSRQLQFAVKLLF